MTDRERKKLAQRLVRKVLDDLLDRRGFRQVWDGCDEATKKEIRNSLVDTLAAELKRGLVID